MTTRSWDSPDSGYAELLARFEELRSNTALIAPHLEYVARNLRPRVDLVASERFLETGASRFGGLPDLPRSAEWPMYDAGPYRFLGQVNLADGIARNDVLPVSGLLSFFAADDEDQSVDYRDERFVRVIYSAAGTVLEPRAAPSGALTVGQQPVDLRVGIDLPHSDSQLTDWPDEKLARVLDRWLEQAVDVPSGRLGYLLGYPPASTLGYDPTPSPGWTPLLTLYSSHGESKHLQLFWHDGDPLHVFVPTRKLLDLDFGEIRCDAG